METKTSPIGSGKASQGLPKCSLIQYSTFPDNNDLPRHQHQGNIIDLSERWKQSNARETLYLFVPALPDKDDSIQASKGPWPRVGLPALVRAMGPGFDLVADLELRLDATVLLPVQGCDQLGKIDAKDKPPGRADSLLCCLILPLWFATQLLLSK